MVFSSTTNAYLLVRTTTYQAEEARPILHSSVAEPSTLAVASVKPFRLPDNKRAANWSVTGLAHRPLWPGHVVLVKTWRPEAVPC